MEAPTALSLYPWQMEAYHAWRAAGKRGVIEAVTGTGKTRLGLLALIGQQRVRGKTLVIVPSVMLMKQWHREIAEILPRVTVGSYYARAKSDFRSHDVIIGVVNSIREGPPELHGFPGLLIADECHRYGSEQNSTALGEQYAARLGLSATYARTDSGNQDYLDPYFGSVVFRISYGRALDERIVTPFVVGLLGIPLGGNDQTLYDAAREDASNAKRALNTRFNVPREPFGEFIKAVQELARDQAADREAQKAARRYLRAFSEQRRIVADSPAKLAALRSLAPLIVRSRRTLIFAETIGAAMSVAAALAPLGARAIHSEHSESERHTALELFRSGTVPILVAPRILDEGIDVPAADLGVIIAASKTRRQMIQRMGRVIRRADGKHIAKFVVLFAENTTEDPGHGAHLAFLEEMVDVAKRVKCFSKADLGALAEFLLGGWRQTRSDTFARLGRAENVELELESQPSSVPLSLIASAGRRAPAGMGVQLACPWGSSPTRLLPLGGDAWRLAEASDHQSAHRCLAGRRVDMCETDELPSSLWPIAVQLARTNTH